MHHYYFLCLHHKSRFSKDYHVFMLRATKNDKLMEVFEFLQFRGVDSVCIVHGGEFLVHQSVWEMLDLFQSSPAVD